MTPAHAPILPGSENSVIHLLLLKLPVCKPTVHVCTMDLNIFQHKLLRSALSQGLNHIPLQPTNIARAIASIMQAYEQLVLILQLHMMQFRVKATRLHLHSTCLSILKASSQTNKWGFQYSGKFLMDIPAMSDETAWLLKHLFCSGLDKATNNACFFCI